MLEKIEADDILRILTKSPQALTVSGIADKADMSGLVNSARIEAGDMQRLAARCMALSDAGKILRRNTNGTDFYSDDFQKIV